MATLDNTQTTQQQQPSSADSTTNTAASATSQPKLEGKALEDAIKKQIEYYLSRENLSTDYYLTSRMNNEMFVAIEVIANFKMVKNLTTDMNLIVEVMSKSSNVTLDETKTLIKPSFKLQRNIIILRDIPTETPVEEIRGIFSETGKTISSVRSDIGNYWFIQFDKEEDALEAHDQIKNLTFKDKQIKARIKSESLMKTPSPVQQHQQPHQQGRPNGAQFTPYQSASGAASSHRPSYYNGQKQWSRNYNNNNNNSNYEQQQPATTTGNGERKHYQRGPKDSSRPPRRDYNNTYNNNNNNSHFSNNNSNTPKENINNNTENTENKPTNTEKRHTQRKPKHISHHNNTTTPTTTTPSPTTTPTTPSSPSSTTTTTTTTTTERKSSISSKPKSHHNKSKKSSHSNDEHKEKHTQKTAAVVPPGPQHFPPLNGSEQQTQAAETKKMEWGPADKKSALPVETTVVTPTSTSTPATSTSNVAASSSSTSTATATPTTTTTTTTAASTNAPSNKKSTAQSSQQPKKSPSKVEDKSKTVPTPAAPATTESSNEKKQPTYADMIAMASNNTLPVAPVVTVVTETNATPVEQQ
ncbi:hypothetical protein RB653_008892 [Dictyostelium firmibasis]|uniref:HTH La-type RNA-binding domain-containing protein n=1 Tax=Dictyostelium firmibasis TaxID=79012 RepID=A0AAN7UDB6_9MYCE